MYANNDQAEREISDGMKAHGRTIYHVLYYTEKKKKKKLLRLQFVNWSILQASELLPFILLLSVILLK